MKLSLVESLREVRGTSIPKKRQSKKKDVLLVSRLKRKRGGARRDRETKRDKDTISVGAAVIYDLLTL